MSALETVFFIDQRPNVWSIISRIRLNVKMHIKILSSVILLVLDVPYPLIIRLVSLVSPYLFIFCLEVFPDLIGNHPVLGDIFFITSTNTTAFWFAKFIHIWKWAFWVDIQSENLEEFCLDKLVDDICSFIIKFFDLLWVRYLKLWFYDICRWLINRRQQKKS